MKVEGKTNQFSYTNKFFWYLSSKVFQTGLFQAIPIVGISQDN